MFRYVLEVFNKFDRGHGLVLGLVLGHCTLCLLHQSMLELSLIATCSSVEKQRCHNFLSRI